MINLSVVWVVQQQPIANAASFTQFRITAGSLPPATVPISERQYNFSDIQPGDYHVTVELINAAGDQVGGVASADVTVPEMAPVPTTVTLSFNVS